MDATLAANDPQRRNWNEVAGPKWIRLEALQEAWLDPVAELLLAHAAPAAGQRVLEIGCGTGTLLSRLAASVAPGGSVTGIDIAATMLDRARDRAPAGVRLIEVDAQTAVLDGPYDLMLSRFGVMFFADPVAAFANLRGALQPRGRLCFVCWGTLDDVPLWRDALAIASRHLGPPEPGDPHAPGPFALADPARVRAVLEAAGFGQIVIRTRPVMLTVGDAAAALALALQIGPTAALIGERAATPATVAAIAAEIERTYRPAPVRVHLVAARG